jgi:hypothetical protein
LAGQYEWTAVNCDNSRSAPTAVFVEDGWPAAEMLGALVAKAAQWMLDKQCPAIAAASGLGPTETVANMIRTLPAHKLLTEDFESSKRRTRQVRGEPPPLTSFGDRAWPKAPGADVSWDMLDTYVQELIRLGWRSVNSITVRSEGKVGSLVALPILDPFPTLPRVSYVTSEREPDRMLRALVLLVHSLFRSAFGPDEAPGMAIMSVHHKASIADEAGFTWFSRACSCDREAVALVDAQVAADLLARASATGGRPPRGKPRRCLLYAYVGGGVSRQPNEVTGLVLRSRHVGLTAAVITAFRLVSHCWPGQARVGVEDLEHHMDSEEGAFDAQPLLEALGRLEPYFNWMLEGDKVANIYKLLSDGWVRPPPPHGPLELIRIQQETELLLDDECTPDWG